MKRSEVFNTLRIVVLGFMLLLILFVGYLNFGYRPVVVISNSMEPKYLTNSVVLVDTKVKFKDLEVGDVINYNHNEHKGIVHRVFQKNEIKKGTVILTSGINPDTNKIVDNWVVLEEMYQGKVVKGYNWTAPIITFLFGNLVDKNPLHILFGFSIIFLIVLGLIVGSIKLINLIKRGCIKMRERVVTTDVYMITEHKKDRIKPSIKFKGVLGKMVVSALVISTLTTATGNVYAATPIDAAEKYNHTATITYNYEISIENKVFEVEQTIKAIEEMKAKGIVSNETLTKLANELMSLEQAVQLSGKGVTKEAEDVVLRAEETVKGVNGAETVIAVISIVKDTLGIESVIISNKEAQATVTSFSDVQKGQWFYNDVMTLSGKGIISGVSAPVNGVGKYDPQGTVSLGQFLAISTRLVAKDNIKEITNAAHWAVPNYVAAIESGLISSRDFSSTVEALNSGISREDMAYILVNVAKMNGETLTRKDGIKNNIKDFNSISKGRQEAVMKAYSNGLLVGDNAGNFNPKKTLTRAEVAAVFCRVMNYTTRPTVEVKTPVKELTGTEKAKEVFNQIQTYNQKTDHGLMFGDKGYTLDDVSTFAFNFLTAYFNYDATDKASIDKWEKDVLSYMTTGSVASILEEKQKLITIKDKCKSDIYLEASKIEIKEGNFIVHAVAYDYVSGKTFNVDVRIGGHNINKSEIAVGLVTVKEVK